LLNVFRLKVFVLALKLRDFIPIRILTDELPIVPEVFEGFCKETEGRLNSGDACYCMVQNFTPFLLLS
jgi:hypothetical protein